MSDALVGATVAGRYRVTGLIGKGAMATVYRAEQDAEPRQVALKVMHGHLTSDPTFVGRFKREAQSASRLAHPHIVRILDYGQDGEVFYLAMELLEGRELGQVIKLERRIAEARAAKILAELFDALALAHDQGIVHRDLKPDNIMLQGATGPQNDGTVKVLDFGIAKLLVNENDDEQASTALTRVGVVVGSPAYMSPEQCRGEAVGTQSDLYACGVVLFELLTGKPPFQGESPIDIAMAHVRTPAPRVTELVDRCHPGMQAVLDRLLAKKPFDRFPSAREARAELLRIVPELATSAAQPIQPGQAAPQVPAQAHANQAVAPMGQAPMAPMGQAPMGMGQAPMGMGQAPMGQAPMAPMSPAAAGGAGAVWLLVPLAIALGVGAGLAAFYFVR